MKKVIFGAAALLCTGALFAQTTQLPSQSSLTDLRGNSSADAIEVAPLHTTDVGQNAGESIQNGNMNKVQVMQAGVNNSVYTNQADGLGTGGNQARVWQTGDIYSDSGWRNVADVQQLGTENQSHVQQEGDTNEAVTKQGMKEATLGVSERNLAYINHGTGENGETNYASIEQDGADNSAKTVQQFDNNEARTVQEGDDNIADVRQNAGPNQSAGHSVLAEQYGDDNVTKVRQYGENRNQARSTQEGSGNIVNQMQTSDGGTGIGNRAVASQGTDLPTSSAGGIVNAAQLYADALAIDNVQNGAYNPGSENGRALQIQNGNNNEAATFQFGAGAPQDSNISEQRQNGDSNAAMIVQNAFGNSNGGGNYARQDQGDMDGAAGNNNGAAIAQNGMDHKAYQRQYGNDNVVLSTQRGDGNRLNTYQSGDNNIAHTGQRGVDNTVLLVQKQQAGFPGHSYKVSQNLPGGTPVGAPNGGNVADILQLGPDGGAGEACDFEMPTDLSSPGANDTFDITNPCGAGC